MTGTNQTNEPEETVRIRVTVPKSVASFYEARGASFGASASAAAAPVLCAMARGEIQQPGFVQQPNTDLRPR